MELNDQTLDEILSGRSSYLEQHSDDAALAHAWEPSPRCR